MIPEDEYKKAADLIGCSVATIKAVAQVESNGNGFLPNGDVTILFEPHIFWKELKKRGISPADYQSGNEDILYPIWGTRPYGKASEQHARLDRASKIRRDAALASTSWGKFQIMGFNWHLCGFQTIEDFVSAMKKNEDEHLRAFTRFILNRHLNDELRSKAWAQFAYQYNGSAFSKNKYDVKLEQAYNALK